MVASLEGSAYYSPGRLLFSAEIWIAGLVVSMIMFVAFSALLYRTYQAREAGRGGAGG